MKQSSQSPPSWQIFIVLSLGVVAISWSAIFIRLAIAASEKEGIGFSLFLAAARLILASVVVLPAWRKFKPTQTPKKALLFALGAGISLALHFATWITSLSFTSITASTTIVTTNPIWISLLLWLWFREKPAKLTLLGIAIALGGGGLIAWGSAEGTEVGSNPLLGDGLALLGAWCASLYLIWGREAQRQGLGTGVYIAIAYTSAALILAPLPFLFNTPYDGYSPWVYIYVLLMALFSQVLGHTSFNWSIRWLSPTLITLVILLEPVGASLLGFFLFQEIPGLYVLTGAGVLLLGVILAVLGFKQPG
ncbi:DMT family transporter [Spirulina subsalsa FACHB-351]|uniref:DMT family transporter n=1 Tax=Spirulina subsalsa FACHB-351 TaxID=234711 RepID=A0ABT3L739_9CYAN|nr:DMT family transporter [Spirulina subsalsa]MCW6036775.1 DMT family transporter [Spirulina subsalsa FACHB-351]